MHTFFTKPPAWEPDWQLPDHHQSCFLRYPAQSFILAALCYFSNLCFIGTTQQVNHDSTINFQNLETISGETELSPPELFAANLIEWSLERHASDLFLSDIDGAVLVSVRRLGRVEPVRKLARDYGHRL